MLIKYASPDVCMPTIPFNVTINKIVTHNCHCNCQQGMRVNAQYSRAVRPILAICLVCRTALYPVLKMQAVRHV